MFSKMMSLLKKELELNSRNLGPRWAEFLKRQYSDLKILKKENKEIENNPYYAKYAEKIKKANAETLKISQNELSKEEKKVRSTILNLDGKFESSLLSKKDGNSETDNGNSDKIGEKKVISKKDGSKSIPASVTKSLNNIMKLELIEKLEKEEIKNLWIDYFKGKDDCIFACIDDVQYAKIKENIRKFPIFIFILPIDTKQLPENEKNSYQFVLVQFVDNQAYFTPLILYQKHGENAPSTLTITHFEELQKSKQLVLLKGEFDNKTFNLLQAQCLANQVQIFYSGEDKEKLKLLEIFNNNPKNFDHMKLVKEFEKSFSL